MGIQMVEVIAREEFAVPKERVFKLLIVSWREGLADVKTDCPKASPSYVPYNLVRAPLGCFSFSFSALFAVAPPDPRANEVWKVLRDWNMY